MTDLRAIQATAVAAFTDEFRQSLPTILSALDSVERDRSNRAAVKEAHRLIHALKGGASMVGLAAFGYLLNVAEELIEAPATGSAAVTDEVVEGLRACMPRFALYMDAALAGQPVEPIAVGLARTLRIAGGVADIDSLKNLIEIEAREVAQLPSEHVEIPAPPAEETPSVPLPEPIVVAPPAEAAETAADDVVASHPSPVTSHESSVTSQQPEGLETRDWRPETTETTEAHQSSEAFSHDARADAPPAATLEFDVVMTDEVPPELAEVFGEEAREHLETIARLTLRLSSEPQDRESVQELRRAVHTLKGAAGVVGYKGASKLAHRAEDLLDRLYEGTAALTPRETRVLASASDALHDLIVGTSDADALRASVIRLFAEFDELVGPGPVQMSPDAMAAFAAGETPVPAVAEADAPVEEALSAPAVARVVAEPQPRAERRRRSHERRNSGQALRVPVQRLNELVRVVSELVINRSTFEQHHGALIEQVDELKLSTARLRRVTHRLESEYEVRALGGGNVVAGPGRATGAGGHGFDELEFDRYTEFHLLTRELTETASDIATIGARVAGTIGDFDSDLTRLGRLTREVQDKTMEFRMVPLGTLTTQLERAVRATSHSCGKQVDFAIEGEHVALDKSLLEQMADPLLHLLRNAVDHGIESPERRLAAGKPERGQITVRAFHEGTDVLIEVQDDGGGLDIERIRRTAVTRGLVTEAAAATMTADALYGFIFEPGFSTAEQVSEVSGRGVGMDIVKAQVGRLSGRVYITSQAGSGTTISVRVPMTLAIARVLLVRVGGETFGLPLGAVVQIVRPHPTSISLVGAERVFTLDSKTYPLRDLAETLGLSRTGPVPPLQPVLIANLSRRRVALAVDEIVNSRDAVVKKLGSHLRHVPGVWGATLMGDGTVVLILNPADLAGAVDEPVVVRHPKRRLAAENAPYNVLIVDDSLSMRHVLSMAVKKAGWHAVPARDGLEALEIIDRGTQPPDVVLLDIEMPRMDGFEFLSTIRAQSKHVDLPIVMLTSRGGPRHREKAKSLGVTDYMVKPFQEDTLISNIDRLVKESRQGNRRAAS
jgi:chemosensory pili system protein ChpA (sensor histidine kinase/response regulator)